MRHKKRFRMACARQRRNVMRDHVSSESGDLAADARSFTGEDGELLFGKGLVRIYLAGGANAFYRLYVESEVWCVSGDDGLLLWDLLRYGLSRWPRSELDLGQYSEAGAARPVFQGLTRISR